MLVLRWRKQNKQKSSCKEAAMSAEQLEQKQIIINRLKEDGCRITK